MFEAGQYLDPVRGIWISRSALTNFHCVGAMAAAAPNSANPGDETQYDAALRRLRDLASQLGALPADPDGGNSIPGWTMSVRGDRLMALRAMGAGSHNEANIRFWSGQFETPLRVSERPETAPNRAFRQESRSPAPGLPKQK